MRGERERCVGPKLVKFVYRENEGCQIFAMSYQTLSVHNS